MALSVESPAGTTHVGAMLLFKKPAGRAPIVREIVEAYRASTPVTKSTARSSLGGVRPISREVTGCDLPRWAPGFFLRSLL